VIRPQEKYYFAPQLLEAPFDGEGKITFGRVPSKNHIGLKHSSVNPTGHMTLYHSSSG